MRQSDEDAKDSSPLRRTPQRVFIYKEVFTNLSTPSGAPEGVR